MLGLNGAGKSTLLRIMASLESDFDGEAWAAEGAKVGYLPQEPELDPAKGLLGADRASAFVRDWLEVFPIAAADDATLTDAMDAVDEHRLSFWDAMLWACARRGGCAAVLSEDFQDGRRLSGITFVDPFVADADVRLAALWAE